MSLTNRGAAWFPQDGSGANPSMMMGQATPPNFMQPQMQPGAYASHSPAGMLTPGAWSVPEASTPMTGDLNGQAGAAGADAAANAAGIDPAMLALMQQQQQSSCCDCCGSSPGGGCCPTQGQPMDPFCCTTPGSMVPGCLECIYTCMDYTFLLMIILFVLCVVGFALVLGLKDIDNIFAYFNVTDSVALEMAIRPYIMWRNVTDNETNSSDSDALDTTTTTTTTTTTSTTTTTTTTTTAPLFSTANDGSRFAQYLAAPSASAGGAAFSSHESYVSRIARLETGEEEGEGGEEAGSSSSDSEICANVTEKFPKNCTTRHLLGSFGTICMEGNMNANVMATQLSHWNNAKATLWFLALVYTGVAIIYAVLIHRQRNPAVPFVPPQLNPQQMQSMTQAQREQMMFMLMQQQQQQAACCGAKGVEVYDTPLYEFIRIAWLFIGFTVFCWTCNLFISFWAFAGFYQSHSTEFLHDFWKAYASKFTGSVVMVTIYLAWPVCNFFLELVVWIIGFLPWLAIRSCCKPGINMYRPELPNGDLPGWIRTDMFFTDFNDVKRLGFSRQAWIILTGKSTPFWEGCSDLTVDRDPTMKQLMDQMPTMQFANFMQQQQLQQQQQMMMMAQMPQGMHPDQMPGQMPMPVATTAVPVHDMPAAASGAAPPASSERHSHRHRRSSKSRERSQSRTRRHGAHADPQADGAAVVPSPSGAVNTSLQLDATSAAVPPVPDADVASMSRRHRSHSRAATGAEGESASRSRRHRSSASKQADEADAGAAASRSGRHRSSSRNRTAEDGGSRSRAHRSRSRERSKERKKKTAQADLDALAEL